MLVVSIVIVGAYRGIVDPLWSGWNEVQHRLVEKQRELSHLRREQVRRQESAESGTLKLLGGLWTASSSVEHTAFAVKTITGLCRKCDLRLESAQPMTTRIEKGCTRHPIRVAVVGTLEGLTDLLLRINGLKGALNVEYFSLRSNAGPETAATASEITSEIIVSSFSSK